MRRWLVVVGLGVLSGCELPVATGTCQGPQAYAIGETVTNEAFVDDCDGPRSLIGDVYQFTLAAHTGFTVEMDPAGFRAAIEVYEGEYGVTAAPRRVAATDGNSSGTQGARIFLPPGQYFIIAGPAERDGGSYQLSTALLGHVDCAYPAFTIQGTDITGIVTNADCSAAPPLRQDIYEVWLPAGAFLKAIVQANRPGIILLRTGSASSPDLASRAFGPNVADSTGYTVPSAGWYRVHVLSNPNATGPMDFTLKVR